MTLTELASAVRKRIQWEVANGVSGYPQHHPSAKPPTDAGGRAQPRRHPLHTLKEKLGHCQLCPVHAERTDVVMGEGAPDSRLAIVVGAPVADEDGSARILAPAEDTLLTRIIEAIGLTRSEVYVCNGIKCHTPSRRFEHPGECAPCGDILRRELEIVQPAVVVAMGQVAATLLLGQERSVDELRGRFHSLGGMSVIATFDPATLLADPRTKRPVWEDMKQVQQHLNQS